MRKIGDLADERHARVFSDALYVRGYENDVETEENGTFSVWVHDDDQLAATKELLERFRASPDATEWQKTASNALRKRKEEERENAKRGRDVITHERIQYERNFSGFAWLPMVLAILSIAATIWAGELGFRPSDWTPDDKRSEDAEARAQHIDRMEKLTITVRRTPSLERFLKVTQEIERTRQPSKRQIMRLWFDPTLPEVRSGQVWRLFTPIFVHFGILHLVFNLMWIRELGNFIQNRFGALYLTILVLTSAAVSNLAQFAWSLSPYFGGLSGVNYALFGFLWMRGRFDRFGFWTLSPQIVQTMMIWFVICFTPLMPNIANGAHTAGLLFGMLCGFATAKFANYRRTHR